MSKEACKRILKEQGISGFVLHYGARVLTKTEKQVIGRFTARFCKVKQNRLVFKNRENLDYTDNPRAFFDYLVKEGYNEKYEIIWLVSDLKKFRKLKYKNVKFVTAEINMDGTAVAPIIIHPLPGIFSFPIIHRIFWITDAREGRSSICGMDVGIKGRSVA